MGPKRAASALALALALLGDVGAAQAQRSDPAAAEALFREGRAASDAGDFAKACDKFHESNRLDPAPGTIFNIADCEEKLGHLAAAWTQFREVAQRLPASDERAAIATSRAAALESRVPKLVLSIAAGAPANTRVFRDGVELQAGSLDTPLPVDPGKHVIAIEVPGRAREERTIELREGETKRETLTPGTAPGGSMDGAQPAGSSSTRRTVGFVIGGIGIAGLAVGAVTGIMVLNRKSTVDESCDAAKRCSQEGADAASSGRTLGPISTIGFVVGGVAVATGVVLVLTSGGGEGGEAPKTAVRVGPGALALERTF